VNSAPTIVLPQYKKRYGLVAAKIGATFSHKLGVPMPLDAPEYSTASKTIGLKARTTVQRHKPMYEYGEPGLPGERFPVRALPGATVVLQVQDLSALEPDLAEQVVWKCQHHECAGRSWETKQALFEAHGDNRKLIDEAQKDPRGQAHLYLAVLEIAGKPEIPGITEKRDEGGKVATKAVPAVAGTAPVVMILSDEE
jgi:hypothetical protein